MAKNMRNTNQPSDGKPNDRLWSWKFEIIDWIGVTVASLFFVAYVMLLFRSPEITKQSGMMSSIPLFSVLIISIGLILKPRSNTTRIPAVYLILLSVVGIYLNWSLL